MRGSGFTQTRVPWLAPSFWSQRTLRILTWGPSGTAARLQGSRDSIWGTMGLSYLRPRCIGAERPRTHMQSNLSRSEAEPIMSQPQSQKWLGRVRLALTFQRRPCLQLATRLTKILGLTAVTAVVVSLYSSDAVTCSVPVADGHSH